MAGIRDLDGRTAWQAFRGPEPPQNTARPSKPTKSPSGFRGLGCGVEGSGFRVSGV